MTLRTTLKIIYRKPTMQIVWKVAAKFKATGLNLRKLLNESRGGIFVPRLEAVAILRGTRLSERLAISSSPGPVCFVNPESGVRLISRKAQLYPN